MKKGKVYFQQQFEDDDPLFAVAFHPERSLYATGFVSGQVCMQAYEPDDQDTPQVVSKWATKRHKSSCRAVQFDQEGEHLYSVGTDKVIKRASAESGKVVGKNKDSLEADPSAMLVNESFVVVGDEDAGLSVFDHRTMKRVYHFTDLHDDNITSIVDWPFKNKYHFLTTGSTTVAHLDIRKGDKAVLSTSDDQEDELLSGCLASEKYSVFGMSEGVVTIWDNNRLQDQMNRMRLSDESIDCVMAGQEDNEVYAGGADGIVRKLDVRASKIDKLEYVHSKLDEVTQLELDFEYRLVSTSMDRLKIWKTMDEMRKEEEENPEEEEEEEEQKKRKKQKKKHPGKKHKHGIAQFADL